MSRHIVVRAILCLSAYALGAWALFYIAGWVR